jgi:hypothetical protein
LRERAFGPLLAAGIRAALYHAKKEGDVALGNSLLDELRELAQTYPDDAAVRQELASGLYTTLYNDEEEKADDDEEDEDGLPRRNDALLDELRMLARTYPDDAAVRQSLASSLFTKVYMPNIRNVVPEEWLKEEYFRRLLRLDLVDELRALARSYPDDPTMRDLVARALLVSRQYDALGALPKDDPVINRFRIRTTHAMAIADAKARIFTKPSTSHIAAERILNALADANAEGDRAWYEELLDNLRTLALAYPDDPVVRERLVTALFNTLTGANAEGDLARRDALLDELRALAQTYPDDPVVRQRLNILQNC